MVASEMVITYEAERLSYDDACRISRRAIAASSNGWIILGMNRVSDTSTAALARLAVLRLALLRAGRDLRLHGLVGRAESVYRVNRLEGLLPRQTPSQSGVSDTALRLPDERA